MPGIPGHFIRRSLGVKIFLSYLIVIAVGVTVLATAAELAVPSAFQRHMAEMGIRMGSMMGGGSMMSTLFSSFRAAVTEALTLAALAAGLAAVVVSLLVSRQLAAPVQAMTRASQRIAGGHYDERVEMAWSAEPEDLDELGQLALAFNRMAAQLEGVESMRRQLIGDVAHELRTPLTTIKGSLEGLIDGVLPPNAETYQSIYREADRLQRLVSNLQELSRVEGRAYELDLQPAAAGDVIRDTYQRLERQFEEKGVGLNLDLPVGLPLVRVDPDRIGQVLLNLVGNALQYTPSGGQVTIHARHAGGQVQISIADTGIGIPPEHLPHLFTRFYRVDKSRSRAGGGSGIGLTIAKYLVEAHGGRIWAESPGEGQGSTFSFTLPAVE